MPNSKKVKTNLNVDELAILFKILNEYDQSDKKIIQDYNSKRELHNAVISSFTTKTDIIGLNSYESKDNSIDQLNAVEFWVNKFRDLRTTV